MGDTVSKYHDQIFFHDERPVEKRVILTPLEACNIVNKLLLLCKDEELIKEAETLKKWIWKTQDLEF